MRWKCIVLYQMYFQYTPNWLLIKIFELYFENQIVKKCNIIVQVRLTTHSWNLFLYKLWFSSSSFSS